MLMLMLMLMLMQVESYPLSSLSIRYCLAKVHEKLGFPKRGP